MPIGVNNWRNNDWKKWHEIMMAIKTFEDQIKPEEEKSYTHNIQKYKMSH